MVVRIIERGTYDELMAQRGAYSASTPCNGAAARWPRTDWRKMLA
jgi:hypothetical protein